MQELTRDINDVVLQSATIEQFEDHSYPSYEWSEEEDFQDDVTNTLYLSVDSIPEMRELEISRIVISSPMTVECQLAQERKRQNRKEKKLKLKNRHEVVQAKKKVTFDEPMGDLNCQTRLKKPSLRQDRKFGDVDWRNLDALVLEVKNTQKCEIPRKFTTRRQDQRPQHKHNLKHVAFTHQVLKEQEEELRDGQWQWDVYATKQIVAEIPTATQVMLSSRPSVKKMKKPIACDDDIVDFVKKQWKKLKYAPVEVPMYPGRKFKRNAAKRIARQGVVKTRRYTKYVPPWKYQQRMMRIKRIKNWSRQFGTPKQSRKERDVKYVKIAKGLIVEHIPQKYVPALMRVIQAFKCEDIERFGYAIMGCVPALEMLYKRLEYAQLKHRVIVHSLQNEFCQMLTVCEESRLMPAVIIPGNEYRCLQCHDKKIVSPALYHQMKQLVVFEIVNDRLPLFEQLQKMMPDKEEKELAMQWASFELFPIIQCKDTCYQFIGGLVPDQKEWNQYWAESTANLQNIDISKFLTQDQLEKIRDAFISKFKIPITIHIAVTVTTSLPSIVHHIYSLCRDHSKINLIIGITALIGQITSLIMTLCMYAAVKYDTKGLYEIVKGFVESTIETLQKEETPENSGSFDAIVSEVTRRMSTDSEILEDSQAFRQRMMENSAQFQSWTGNLYVKIGMFTISGIITALSLWTGKQIDYHCIKNHQMRKAFKETADDVQDLVEDIGNDWFGIKLSEDVLLHEQLEKKYKRMQEFLIMEPSEIVKHLSLFYEMQKLHAEVVQSVGKQTKSSKHGTRQLQTSICTAIVPFGMLVQKVLQLQTSKTDRVETIAVQLYGEPACGKTTFVKEYLVPELCKKLNLPLNDVYSISFANDNDYFPEYVGQIDCSV
jgi:hypothetical protein